MIKLIKKKWETDFITFPDLYGFTVLGISDLEKWKAYLNITKLKQTTKHTTLWKQWDYICYYTFLNFM